MTVSTTKNRNDYDVDGVSTGPFPYEFLLQQESDLQVYENGVITTKAYSVSGVGNSSGGSVTFTGDPPAAGQLSLIRVIPLTQNTDYRPYDAFPAERLEQDLDRAILIDQQLEEQIGRSVQFPPDETGFNPYIPSASERAGKLFGWDGAGETIAVSASDQSATSVTPISRSSSRTLAVQASLAQHWYDVKDPDFGAAGNGTTDDTAAIQAAIDAAKASNGGVVFLPPGIYPISVELLIDSSNVLLLGSGADTDHTQSPLLGQASTQLRWTGAAGGTMVRLTSPQGATNQKMVGGGVGKIAFDANGLAATGLKIESRQGAAFSELYFNEFSTVGIDVGVVTTLGDATDTQRCLFERVDVRAASAANGIGIRLSGSSAGNPSFNYFRSIDIRHQDGTGIECGNSDNNLFENIRIFRGSSGSAVGLLLKAGATAVETCRANYFVHLNATNGGVKAEGTPTAAVASYDNHILFYDKDNNSPDPVIETDAMLYWQGSDGAWRDFMVDQLAVGNNLTNAQVARAALGNNTGIMVVQNNEAHVQLRDFDGNDIWKIFINNTNGSLQFNRIAGSGGFTIPGNGAAPLFLTNTKVMSGTGSPEGVIAAPVGSLWLRTNGGANTTLYIKETGTGTTGWAAK